MLVEVENKCRSLCGSDNGLEDAIDIRVRLAFKTSFGCSDSRVDLDEFEVPDDEATVKKRGDVMKMVN